MMTEHKDKNHKDNKDIDEAVEETFPASDPPSWMAGKGAIGAADDQDDHKKISKEEEEWLKERKKKEQKKDE
jgi:hypothetical protein